MSKHYRDELLSAYVDGELRPDEAEQVAVHLAGCPACRGAVQMLRLVREAAAGLPQMEPPPGTWQTIRERTRSRTRPVSRRLWWAWLGVPALAATVLVVALVLPKGAPEPDRVAASADRPADELLQPGDDVSAAAARDYAGYVQGLEQAIQECEQAMQENPGNMRVRLSYLGARSSQVASMDRLVSEGD